MEQRPTYAEATAALAQLGLDEGASAYHGVLCGTLCVREPDEIDVLRLVEGEIESAPNSQALTTLLHLRDAASAGLADVQAGFMPLLPEEESGLSERATALSQWCEGFVYGLAACRQLDLQQCSEEVRELVRDFTEFTRAALHETDDIEAEERAYVELVEYIRVGTQLIFMELRAHRQRDPTNTRTLH